MTKIYTVFAKNNSRFLNEESSHDLEVFRVIKGDHFFLELGNGEAVLRNSEGKKLTLKDVKILLRLFSIPGVSDNIVIRNFATVDLCKKRDMISIWR